MRGSDLLLLKNVLRAWVGLLAVLLATQVLAYEEEAPWEEQVPTALPAPPKEENLLPFDVSALADSKFFIDKASLSVGSDGVVRYTLVVISAGGARNVSYEGIRCSTTEWRSYAYGRDDGSWVEARRKSWLPVRYNSLNRQQAALYSNAFCVNGYTVESAAVAIRNLQYPPKVTF